jgi:hypothetical protein
MALFSEMMDDADGLKDEIASLKKANQILHGLLSNRDAEIERLREALLFWTTEARSVQTRVSNPHSRCAQNTEEPHE